MLREVSAYLRLLVDEIGQGWNRFWFRRSDPFVLGLMRLLTGLMALYAVAAYTPDLERLFAQPGGVLSLQTVDELRARIDERYTEAHWSYLDYLYTRNELLTAHIVGLVVLALFAAGLFTRVMSIAALVVVLSYIHRAPALTGQLEPVLAMVMFYLCLAPAGARWSIDALLARRRRKPEDTAARPALSLSANIATRLLQLHMSVIYLMMGIAKLSVDSATWWFGDAVWWLMARTDAPLIDLTGLFVGHPYLINFWTHAIVAFELSFAVLIWNRLARPLLLALAVPMWLSLAVISGLAPFCLMMLIANLAFFSPEFLRRTFSRG